VRVLVTGGAGFIGSHVVDRLRAHGHEPRIFDLVRSRYHSAGEVEMVRGDLLDEDAVRRALRGCDAAVHLAAVADVNEVVADPVRAVAVNVRGTQTILEAARIAGIERFVFGSTVWVYDSAPVQSPIDEDAPLASPSHVYTATKRAGEMYCRSYEERFGLSQTILRFGIPYGPRLREAAVVAAFVARARAGKALRIAGDGRQSRQFVYVEELAGGVVAALAPAAVGRIYNLVGEESVSVRQIADTVRELVEDVPIVYEAARPGDLRIGSISGTRAATELGWRAETRFAEGMRRYVEWVTQTSGSPVSPAVSMTGARASALMDQEPTEL
jgi:UDP-glucose 4-epimerase